MKINYLKFRPITQITCAALLGICALTACVTSHGEDGFVSLFNGKNLKGWKYIGAPAGRYSVRHGVMDCPATGNGNLITDEQFSDFVLRLEYKYEAGGNNGVAIRVPDSTENLTYVGVEIQMLDDTAPKHRNLHPWQYNGSVYGIAPAKNGAGIIGAWNNEEITCVGRHYKITLNGRVIVDTDLNDVHDPEVLRSHPGMLRDRGHIGFLGHWSHFQFRNIRIKSLPVENKDNTPPAGFVALFNGDDLKGWKGLVADPPTRAKMTPEKLSEEQAKADASMNQHWAADNGEIVFDGHGENLCTSKDYGDFEMLVDWKIPSRGDSGIYLRGSPQVQIWEPHSPGQFTPPDGSGGLYNNETNRHPLMFADKPVGEWNHFRILMVGDKVHVFLNDDLVVRDTTMENYWERDKPIYSIGQIELQNHFGPLWFKNIYIRELPRQ
jgi:hypothetical protein